MRRWAAPARVRGPRVCNGWRADFGKSAAPGRVAHGRPWQRPLGGYTRRTRVDECRTLSTHCLSGGRWRRLEGALAWGDEPSAFRLRWAIESPAPRSLALVVHYWAAGSEIEEAIPLVLAATLPGGRRRCYLRCPGCGRRVVKLHKPIASGGTGAARWFRCRRCHGLAYRSQLDEPSLAHVLAWLARRWPEQAADDGHATSRAAPRAGAVPGGARVVPPALRAPGRRRRSG